MQGNDQNEIQMLLWNITGVTRGWSTFDISMTIDAALVRTLSLWESL
jgi:hypothetical protein